MTQTRNVAILIFEDVEILDFAGPYEVFAVTRQHNAVKPFNVYTVAATSGPITARNGLSVNPTYTIDNCPTPDLLVIPGGRGTRKLLVDETVLNWVRRHAEPAEQVMSVCTGALVLGRAGLLDGLAATTYHSDFEELREVAPTTELRPGQRWVDNGKIVTSAGVSAGIDTALYVVGKLLGPEHAEATARYMEYDYWPSAVQR